MYAAWVIPARAEPEGNVKVNLVGSLVTDELREQPVVLFLWRPVCVSVESPRASSTNDLKPLKYNNNNAVMQIIISSIHSS